MKMSVSLKSIVIKVFCCNVFVPVLVSGAQNTHLPPKAITKRWQLCKRSAILFMTALDMSFPCDPSDAATHCHVGQSIG